MQLELYLMLKQAHATRQERARAMAQLDVMERKLERLAPESDPATALEQMQRLLREAKAETQDLIEKNEARIALLKGRLKTPM